MTKAAKLKHLLDADSFSAGIFIVPYLLWHGISIYISTRLVASYDKPGVIRGNQG